MRHQINRALLGTLATALLLAPAAAVAAKPITVRVEGAKRTLLGATAIKLPSREITKGGTPTGACPGRSAAGALDVATRHRWDGKYYASVPGIFISSILGEKPTGNDYWTVFVNNRSAPKGICDIRPKPGTELLFAVTNGSQFPLVVNAPASGRVGTTITVGVGYYHTVTRAHRTVTVFSHPAGIRLTGTGVSASTDAHGRARVQLSHAGVLVLRAEGQGYVRSAALRIRETP